MRLLWALLLTVVSFNILVIGTSAQTETKTQGHVVKRKGFRDPLGYTYLVTSLNITMTTDSTYRSIIKVTRYKYNNSTQTQSIKPELVQAIKFNPTLVDFDLDCQPSHCYLVAVTSRTKSNVKLYAWQRTQFDLVATRDSFARPHAVELFKIEYSFYIAIAQDQLHLSTIRLSQEYEEPSRFIGCAILKFNRGNERKLKYHQFIRLSFDPLHVTHFTSETTNDPISNVTTDRHVSHHLVFSVDKLWNESPVYSYALVWSPLNDYFWPYRMPRNAVLDKPQVGLSLYPILRLPPQPQLQPNGSRLPIIDQVVPTEYCFNQLQRLLTEREFRAQRLIDNSRTLWRSSQVENPYTGSPTNISAQVIVHGNVIVKGSMLQSPQMTVFSSADQRFAFANQALGIADRYSPEKVDNKLRDAFYRLRYIRDKLSRAVSANFPQESTFSSRIKFYAPIRARRVIFNNNGVANSNFLLNGVPFNQLEHELIGLRGAQEVAAKVVFLGNVTADLLEIDAVINDAFLLRDALDITSNKVQIIDEVRYDKFVPPRIEFHSVSAPSLILSPNASMSGLRLEEFITRDSRPQVVYGRKIFKHLTMNHLNLAHTGVRLNNFNISRIALDALRLRRPTGAAQFINAEDLTFTNLVSVNKLIINSQINQHINISSLIYDSVKANILSPQQIYGHKHFTNGLKINHLTTEGSINDVEISQVFNLNQAPPLHDYARYFNAAIPLAPISGDFLFTKPVNFAANLNLGLLNGVDIARHAVRRLIPMAEQNMPNITGVRQIVSGIKTFARPLRITSLIRLLDPQKASQFNMPQLPYAPLVNNLDLRLIGSGIKRLMQNPPIIHVDNLEIEGNLNLNTSRIPGVEPKTIFGLAPTCPLAVFRKKLVLNGLEEQFVEAPIKINSLRSRAIYIDPKGLNGMTVPDDFVLRSPYNISYIDQTEVVYGNKLFNEVQLVPSFPSSNQFKLNNYPIGTTQVLFGTAANINNVTYDELQTFILDERKRNSTGETVYQTMTVYGDVNSKRINRFIWPDDILLKSVCSNRIPSPSPYQHSRIYSPLVFPETNDLIVENQLVLRGPIQLEGRLNGVNLSEFAQQSATYGDKDLLSINRPIRNKVFAGGLTVNGEIRSQGLIGGINIEELKSRAVTIEPRASRVTRITGAKVFLSDVDFLGPVDMIYLNDLLLNQYLKQFRREPDNLVRIFGKKTVTGALRINKNIIVQGNINGINFIDLQLKAISLSPPSEELAFNKTLTVEGDVFMDNLLIDEKNGTIDGVRLINLLPIDSPLGRNELVILNPALSETSTTFGQQLNIAGAVNDCKITCSLTRTTQAQLNPVNQAQESSRALPQTRSMQQRQQFSTAVYPPRQVQYNGKNITMHTPPPYAGNHFVDYQPVAAESEQQVRRVYPDQRRVIQNLAIRKPYSIQYEKPTPIKRYVNPTTSTLIMRENIAVLRRQIISLNLIQVSNFSDIVVGFIDSPVHKSGSLAMLKFGPGRQNHKVRYESFLQLDQIDYHYKPLKYHLSVGVSTTANGKNTTKIFTSVGDNEPTLAVLPVEEPNSAMFCLGGYGALFLLVSQDYKTFVDKYNNAQCPRYSSQAVEPANYNVGQRDDYRMIGGVHVYLFYILQNDSSFKKTHFDLYQTIDLPAVDSFDQFSYHGSTYALAASRLAGKVYLLMLRGYSGFQIVSTINAPGLEFVRIVTGTNQRPILIVHQANGYRVMESVII